MDLWIHIKDKALTLCGTTAIQMGINNINNDFTYHSYSSFSLKDLRQGMGRCARANGMGIETMFLKDKEIERTKDSIRKRFKKADMDELGSSLFNIVDCHRMRMQYYFSDVDIGTCITKVAALCSNCKMIDSFEMVNETDRAQNLLTAIVDMNLDQMGPKCTLSNLTSLLESRSCQIDSILLERLLVKLEMLKYVGRIAR